MLRKYLGFITTVLSLFVAVLVVPQMMNRVRLVDILTLFFGGFGVGVGLVKTIIDLRKSTNP
jgi:hypothetical protein